jgi:GMP synthase-like glutamine amidotransferase
MHAHVLQHVAFEGLGSIEPWLAQRAAVVTATRFFADPTLPDHRQLDLVIALGGPMSVNDEARLPWLKPEKAFVRDAIAHGVPVLGVCLGSQLIAASLGMRVYANPEKEIGWFPIQPEGTRSPFPDGLRVFHWHGETFDLPPGAERLASSPACRNQAFRIGRGVIGLQFHLETTPAAARAMVAHCRDELIPGRYVQPERALLDEPDATYAAANTVMNDLLHYLTAGQTSARTGETPDRSTTPETR